ncbi:glutathione synthase [Ponticaulis profundi]|uniref:Glutathione synthetase n=1 Tax=Ponticaulis profundi TaxID=2665222 RepID=A0ABW1S8P4_9PROT
MPLKIAIQMDPMDQVNIDADTTFALAEVAQARGHEIWTYQPEHLSCLDGRLIAKAKPTKVQRVKDQPAVYGAVERLDLGRDVDVVLMRQDPPFDMSYITAAHLLELLKGETLVVNDPEWVRSSPEKLFPIIFPGLLPETLITRDIEEIAAFRQKHGDIILKPLYGNGGAGVFKVTEQYSNYNSLLEIFMERSREPFIAQAFLPDVSKGDKRVILIDGEPVGAINRVPKEGEARSNLHVGGTAHPVELTDTDIAICNQIGPELKKRGLVLVGIDVIGDKLTEINVTSPTGVQELKRFTGIDASALFWDAVDRRLAAG